MGSSLVALGQRKRLAPGPDLGFGLMGSSFVALSHENRVYLHLATIEAGSGFWSYGL